MTGMPFVGQVFNLPPITRQVENLLHLYANWFGHFSEPLALRRKTCIEVVGRWERENSAGAGLFLSEVPNDVSPFNLAQRAETAARC
jgi:hypothetical protein